MGYKGGRDRRGWLCFMGLLIVLSSCVGDSDAAPSTPQKEPAPCLRLTDRMGAAIKSVDLGAVGSTEARRTARVLLENCDQERPLRIERSSLEGGPGFFVRGLERPKRLIDAGGSREVELVFGLPKESAPGDFEAAWMIEAGGEWRGVPLRASLVDCPPFQVVLDDPTADLPERMVTLSKSSPQALARIVIDEQRQDEIERWEWEVIGGSKTQPGLAIGPEGKTARFLPDSPGYFAINARGIHAQEGVICLPEPRGSVGVHNAVGADVMVVLSWDVDEALRPQQQPSGFELHYRNRRGRWRDEVWDIFYENQQARWGPEGQVEMSHRAFLGGRWESIMHLRPAEEEIIEVGAQRILGIGAQELAPAEVRARIFVYGEEVLDVQRAGSHLWRGWHIAQIRWPQVEEVDQVHRELWDVP